MHRMLSFAAFVGSTVFEMAAGDYWGDYRDDNHLLTVGVINDDERRYPTEDEDEDDGEGYE